MPDHPNHPTDADLLDWLSVHPIYTKWNHRTGWTVRAFGVVEGTAPTLREALERAIEHRRHLMEGTAETPHPAHVDLFAPTQIDNKTA